MVQPFKKIKNRITRDFPGGPAVKNPPSNAGDSGSISGQGTEIPHATGQLSPHATTTEPTRLNKRAHVLQTTEPTHPGARTPELERSTRHIEEPMPKRKILHASTKT